MATRDSDDKVSTADSADNGYIHDVIGNKSDTIAATSLMGATKRIEAAAGGTLGADVTAIKAVTDVIPDAGALTALVADVTAVKAVTDVLPDAGALTTLAGEVTAIKAVTDVLPDAGALTTIAKVAQIEPSISSGTFSYLDIGGTQNIIEVVNTKKVLVKSAMVDCVNLTQNGTLSFWTKPDGTNYRKMSNLDVAFTIASDDSICMKVDIETDKDFKFTWTEGGDEAAARDIYYKISYETRN